MRRLSPFWLALLAVTLLLSLSSKALVGATGWRWLTKYPAAWEARLDRMISAAMKWLVEDAALGLWPFAM